MADPYFKIKKISNSSLGWMYKSPAYYKYRIDFPQFQESTPALTMGSLVHCLVLEPENFNRDFWILKTETRPQQDKGMTSNINKAWKLEQEQEHSEQDLITEDVLIQAEAISKSLNREAKSLITAKGNEFEKTIEWNKDGFDMKGKIDICNDYFLADLKTAQSSDPDTWQRKAYWDFQYYRQAAVYLDGDADGIYTGDKEFYFIVVEKFAPYLVSIHKVSSSIIAKGMVQYRDMLAKIKKCQDSDNWPHYDKEVYEFDN